MHVCMNYLCIYGYCTDCKLYQSWSFEMQLWYSTAMVPCLWQKTNWIENISNALFCIAFKANRRLTDSLQNFPSMLLKFGNDGKFFGDANLVGDVLYNLSPSINEFFVLCVLMFSLSYILHKYLNSKCDKYWGTQDKYFSWHCTDLIMHQVEYSSLHCKIWLTDGFS